jgi:hypothetical protein
MQKLSWRVLEGFLGFPRFPAYSKPPPNKKAQPPLVIGKLGLTCLIAEEITLQAVCLF